MKYVVKNKIMIGFMIFAVGFTCFNANKMNKTLENEKTANEILYNESK